MLPEAGRAERAPETVRCHHPPATPPSVYRAWVYRVYRATALLREAGRAERAQETGSAERVHPAGWRGAGGRGSLRVRSGGAGGARLHPALFFFFFFFTLVTGPRRSLSLKLSDTLNPEPQTLLEPSSI